MLITILLVWEEGGLVGGGTQQYDRVLERVYSPAPNAATSSPFSLIHLGKHDEVSGDTPIIGVGGPNWTSVFTPEDKRRLELEELTGMFRPRHRKSPLLNLAP